MLIHILTLMMTLMIIVMTFIVWTGWKEADAVVNVRINIEADIEVYADDLQQSGWDGRGCAERGFCSTTAAELAWGPSGQ